jgi:hypothetical protein
MKLTPVVKKAENGDLDDVYFDVVLIISKDNELQVIDASENDYTDFCDGNTLLIKAIQLRV